MDEFARTGLESADFLMSSAVYEGVSTDIARARDLARAFLIRVQAEHGIPVSERAMGVTLLVVSELVTNACKHAPGPCLVDLEISGSAVDITVWDSVPVLPVATTGDPGRVGQHGLEIVMAVCQGFDVHREPVGKRTTVSVMLADDPGGDVTGRAPDT
ncbi:ATP-binding protein [Streptomyces sp. NPDC001621]|uniref:ATP-binding protein n=2 Tax=Streptomyces TaxID=1883 RepID=UPI0036C360DA